MIFPDIMLHKKKKIKKKKWGTQFLFFIILDFKP